MDSPEYEEGVCCPRCSADLNDSLRASRRERQRQQSLARTRGGKHIGQQFETPDEGVNPASVHWDRSEKVSILLRSLPG